MQTVYEHIWYGHGQKSKILDATLSTWRERERSTTYQLLEACGSDLHSDARPVM